VRVRRLVVLLLALIHMPLEAQTAARAPGQPAGQPAAQTAPASPPIDVDALPLDLDRIAEQLRQKPVLQLDPDRPIFRLQVFGTRPRWLDEIDWLDIASRGKPPAGIPWNARFLDMVTPPQARSFGASEGTDLLQLLATSYAQGLAAGAVVGKISSALQERRERRAREEVDAAIAEWKRQREAEAAKQQETGETENPDPP
jgi:hypothetical protein